jgi:hypothetical protein
MKNIEEVRKSGGRREGKMRNLTIGQMWDVYFHLNRMKVTTYVEKCKVSKCRWERRWLGFLEDVLSEGEAGNPEMSVRQDALNIVYWCVLPWSRREYIGQTKRGLRHRVQQHLAKSDPFRSLQGKEQRLHDGLKKEGAGRALWIPVVSWPDGNVDRITREVRESELIWSRQPSWNKDGLQGEAWAEMKHVESVLMSKRQKHRPLMKFRGGARMDETNIANVGGDEKSAAERQKRRELLWFAIKLGRRPLKKEENFGELKMIKAIRAAKPSELLRVVRVLYAGVDETTRSIGLANIKEALKDQKGETLLMMRITIKSPAFGIRGLGKQLKKVIRGWARQYARKGVPLCVTARFTTASAPTILQLLENSKQCARMQPEELS